VRLGGYPVPEGLVILPEAFAAGTLAPAAWEAVRTWVAALRPELEGGTPALAVRSSALNEDSAQASFAGEYESVLDVRGEAALQDAIDAVYRSQNTERVRAYSG
jgi:rifampicin phosphotransferase